MNYKEHTRLDLVAGGNVFKQGDHMTLGFTPRDYEGDVVDLTGKDIEGVIYSRRKGIMFTAPADYVTAEQKIEFTIDEVMDHGEFQIEFTVTDAADPEYRRKFPSAEQDGRLIIKPSADNMDVVGVQMTTVSQLKNELQGLQSDFAGQVLPRVDTVEGKQTQLETQFTDVVSGVTDDAEILSARTGPDGTYPTVGARLDATTTQLADKATKEEVANALDGSPKDTYATLTDLQTAFPTGTTGVYLVAADGHIYSWDGSAWVDRGLYQAQGIADKAIDSTKLADTYFFKRRIAIEESMDTVYNDGTYIVTAGNPGTYPIGLPSNTTTKLEVEKNNGRWVTQRISPFNKATPEYVRKIDGSTGTILEAWTRVVTESYMNEKLTPINTRIEDLENNTPTASPFAGKTAVFMGESSSEFSTHPEIVGQRLGMNTINIGVGGTRWTQRPGPYDAFSVYQLANAIASGDWSLQETNKVTAADDDNTVVVNRMVAIDWSAVDFLVIHMLGNDVSGGIAIGAADSTNVANVKGAINYSLEKIMTAYPHLKIFVVSPTWRGRIGLVDGDSDTTANVSGLLFQDYVVALDERAKAHHIPHLDLYNTSGVNKYTSPLYVSSDKVHLTEAGNELTAEKISGFFNANF